MNGLTTIAHVIVIYVSVHHDIIYENGQQDAAV